MSQVSSLKIFRKSKNFPNIWKFSENLKFFRKSENFPKIWCYCSWGFPNILHFGRHYISEVWNENEKPFTTKRMSEEVIMLQHLTFEIDRNIMKSRSFWNDLKYPEVNINETGWQCYFEIGRHWRAKLPDMAQSSKIVHSPHFDKSARGFNLSAMSKEQNCNYVILLEVLMYWFRILHLWKRFFKKSKNK